ncbi:MAG: hypothetical protein ACRD5H_00585 [Nitrososphaerales archaeon]
MKKDIAALRNLLAEQEAIIERNKPILTDIAEALMIIKGEKLWKLGYPSFDIYCSQRWGWGKRTAYYICSPESYQRNLEDKRHKRVPTKECASQDEGITSLGEPHSTVSVAEKRPTFIKPPPSSPGSDSAYSGEPYYTENPASVIIPDGYEESIEVPKDCVEIRFVIPKSYHKKVLSYIKAIAGMYTGWVTGEYTDEERAIMSGTTSI